jgi:hypothetical protein
VDVRREDGDGDVEDRAAKEDVNDDKEEDVADRGNEENKCCKEEAAPFVIPLLSTAERLFLFLRLINPIESLAMPL